MTPPPAPYLQELPWISSPPTRRRALEAKLQQLIEHRPVITDRIAEARAHGDLKENAEYHAARDEQGLEEAEIRRLTERLKVAQVADDVDVPEGMVFLGAVVRLKDTDSGDVDLYKLVGRGVGQLRRRRDRGDNGQPAWRCAAQGSGGRDGQGGPATRGKAV